MHTEQCHCGLYINMILHFKEPENSLKMKWSEHCSMSLSEMLNMNISTKKYYYMYTDPQKIYNKDLILNSVENLIGSSININIKKLKKKNNSTFKTNGKYPFFCRDISEALINHLK